MIPAISREWPVLIIWTLSLLAPSRPGRASPQDRLGSKCVVQCSRPVADNFTFKLQRVNGTWLIAG